MSTGAAMGFTNTLLEVINKEKPTHIGVAFDTSEPTFRHEQFETYKAHRQAQPEDITIAIPYCKKIIEGFGIPILIMPGFEADDIVGTIAKQAAKSGFETFMMTSDKDYGQLVDDHVYVYRPAFMGKGPEVYDRAKILEKFGISRIDQVCDILGLQGDAVDNIPGIPGIGEKTAQKLIAEFDTVENLIANAHQLKGKLQENVINFAEQGILSKQLATIMTDVPVEFDEEKLRYTGPIRELIQPLFEELEFRTLFTRLFGADNNAPAPAAAKKKSPAPAPGQFSMFGDNNAEAKPQVISSADEEEFKITGGRILKTIANTLHDYRMVDTVQMQQALVESLLQQNEFSFDTETTALDALQAELVGISFAYVSGEAFYIPVPADQKEAQAIVEIFRPVFENETITKIGQNVKYDLMVLQNYGIQVKGPFFDTMLAHYLIEPDMRHNMDVLSEDYLGYTPVSITELIGKKGKGQDNMRDIEVEKVTEYAAEDADITLQLKHAFAPKIITNQTETLFNEVEIPLITVLADMERSGIRIDTEALKESSIVLGQDIILTEKAIYEEAGMEFNVGSPKQLGEVLFEKMQLDKKPKKTATGQYATGEEILSKLADEHKIAALILEYRELQKLKSTYVDALPLLRSPLDGKIHTSYNQAVAATGRLSSTNPNLQNIPIRTQKGKEIRKAFVPTDENYVILSADYSQIELRIMAEFSKDATMLEAFKQGKDIHASTASKVFGVPLDQVSGDMRSKAKMVNFGIIYGISAFGLGQRLSIPRREAAEIIDAYFREFPAVKTYMDNTINQARESGYAETILGRKRYLRDINSANMTTRGYAERNAINAPIQGSAADMIKLAMINIHEWMKGANLKSRMILQVHDELIFDAHVSELELLKEKVSELMRTALKLEVPMEVGMGSGQNWLEAH